MSPSPTHVHPLIHRLEKRETSIGVIGLGYVGLPLAVAFARKYSVVGFDINAERIAELSDGHDRTDSIDSDSLKSAAMQYTSDASQLKKCSAIVVAVPTPVTSQQQPDFSPLVKASETIGRNLQKGCYISFESTVYPGATEEWCVPAIEKASGLKCGIDFKIGYSPERINPGDRVHTFSKIIKITSGMDGESAEAFAQLYDSVLENGVHRASSIKVAEAAKVFENAQRDVNIALVNELAFICHKLGMDTHDVLNACKTKWNFAAYSPGLVGGHCIGVDPYYLIAKSQEISLDPMMTRSARTTNEHVAPFVASEIIKAALRVKRHMDKVVVNVLGFTYKEDTPDTRNTQMAKLIREIETAGCSVYATDPWADFHEVHEEYGLNLVKYDELPKANIIVLAVPHKSYRDMDITAWKKLSSEQGYIFDIRAVLPREKFQEAGFNIWRL